MTDTASRQLLGDFIRAHRERLSAPAGFGRRRRTPGLRREELAELAGLSATWVAWLEQGRPVSASASALARLSEALQLNPAERASLFDLAGRRDPQEPEPFSEAVPAEVLALPGTMQVPAYVLDHAWNARAWNDAAGALFVGWLDEAAPQRNLLRFVFLEAGARELIQGWAMRAHRLVAEFRADFSRRPRDESMQALVDDLCAASPEFAHFWADSTVLAREGGERSFLHPVQGEVHFAQITLVVSSQPEIKVVGLMPLSDMPSRALQG